MSVLFYSGLVPGLVVVLAPGAVLDLVPAIHAQGHAGGPTHVPVAVPGHAQTARALVGNLVPAANQHVKAKASHDQSQSEQVRITAISFEVGSGMMLRCVHLFDGRMPPSCQTGLRVFVVVSIGCLLTAVHLLVGISCQHDSST